MMPTYLYAYDADGDLTSTIDCMDNVTATAYDALGQQTAGYQGHDLDSMNMMDTGYTAGTQTSGPSWEFSNLAPTASRPTAPAPTKSTSTGADANIADYTVSDGADANLAVVNSSSDPAATLMGSNWTYLGEVTLPQGDNSDTLTVTYSVSGTAPTAVCFLQRTSATTYDLAGDVLSQTDALGNTTAYTYDLQGNCLSQTDPNGKTTSYTYDAMGNMLTLTDPDNNTTTWTYDHLGRVTSQQQTVAVGLNPDGTPQTTLATTTYSYNADGDLMWELDPDGRLTDFTYDHLGRETGEQWYNAADALTETIAYTYDDYNNIVTASDTTPSGASAVDDYAYDELNRLTITSETVGDGHNLSSVPTVWLTDVYGVGDDTDNVKMLSANIGGWMQYGEVVGGTPDFINNYQYDALGNMTQVMQSGLSGPYANPVAPKCVDFSYCACGCCLTGINSYNSIYDSGTPVAQTTYSYDYARRMLSATNTDGGGNPLSSYGWSYDADGRVTQATSCAGPHAHLQLRRGQPAHGRQQRAVVLRQQRQPECRRRHRRGRQPPALRRHVLLQLRRRRQPHGQVPEQHCRRRDDRRHRLGHHHLHLGQPRPAHRGPVFQQRRRLPVRVAGLGGVVHLRRLRPPGDGRRDGRRRQYAA